ncbi:AbrB/MazE/SpoVT family DNA-binding domain-containing protein [Microbacterium sp.]|jgi:AbrB family looped-hinge helix DNA binding protein|uniref:AbrB/MazE/SpoVT family DNA-binding domain-containing protein n=1 Tax=Microbacterium sp. TaxID=51671 RepID=UPI003C74607D
MPTTIDAAGRLVIPKPVRDAMGLRPGTPLTVDFIDGRIQIEYAPVDVDVDTSEALPRIVPRGNAEPLDDDAVRHVLERTRR